MNTGDDEDLRILAYLGDGVARRTLGAKRLARFDRLPPFVERWFTKSLEPLSKAEMDEYERKLDIALPTALREWCRLVGNLPDCQESQNAICTVGMLEVARRDYGIAVYCENQSNWEYVVRYADFDEDDPFVWHWSGGQPIQTTCRLSECLIASVLDESILQSEYLGHGPFGSFRVGIENIAKKHVEGPAIQALLNLVPRLVGPVSPWRADLADFFQDGLWEVYFHGDADVIIAAEGPVNKLQSAVAMIQGKETLNRLTQQLSKDGFS